MKMNNWETHHNIIFFQLKLNFPLSFNSNYRECYYKIGKHTSGAILPSDFAFKFQNSDRNQILFSRTESGVVL